MIKPPGLRFGTTVAALKAALEKVDPNLMVLVDGAHDHGYRYELRFLEETVEVFPRDGEVKEYWDDSNMSGGVKRQAFVVSIR